MSPQFLILTPRNLQNGYLTLFGDCHTQRKPHPHPRILYGLCKLCATYIRCIWMNDSQGLVATVVSPDSRKSASSQNMSQTIQMVLWGITRSNQILTLLTPESLKSASCQNVSQTISNGLIGSQNVKSCFYPIGTGILEVCE